MIKSDICIDYYRESLQVGDFVIPIYEEVEKLGICGTITKINYIPKDKKHFLTIQDCDGYTYKELWYSRCFSTRERKAIRDSWNYVYALTCYDSNFKRINHLPLYNKTDVDYNIPPETCLISLDANHLYKKNNHQSLGYSLYEFLYFFIIKDTVLITENDHKDGPLLKSNGLSKAINNNYIFFNNMEQLDCFIKKIITYFNEYDLNNINNEKEYAKSLIKQDFQEKLCSKIKKGNF